MTTYICESDGITFETRSRLDVKVLLRDGELTECRVRHDNGDEFKIIVPRFSIPVGRFEDGAPGTEVLWLLAKSGFAEAELDDGKCNALLLRSRRRGSLYRAWFSRACDGVWPQLDTYSARRLLLCRGAIVMDSGFVTSRIYNDTKKLERAWGQVMRDYGLTSPCAT